MINTTQHLAERFHERVGRPMTSSDVMDIYNQINTPGCLFVRDSFGRQIWLVIVDLRPFMVVYDQHLRTLVTIMSEVNNLVRRRPPRRKGKAKNHCHRRKEHHHDAADMDA